LDKRLKSPPNPLHLETESIWWNESFILERHDLTWLELGELGAPKMGGQCQISTKKNLFHKILFSSTNHINLLDFVQLDPPLGIKCP